MVDERIAADGRIVKPLDEADAGAVAHRIKASGYEFVAVMFLHSYVNPAHERRMADILRAGNVGVDVTLSSDVSPKFREYERASTTVANAYVRPLVARYLDGLERLAAGEGFPLAARDHAVERRPGLGRACPQLSDPDRRVRPRRRRPDVRGGRPAS